jgi:hypothetical protein
MSIREILTLFESAAQAFRAHRADQATPLLAAASAAATSRPLDPMDRVILRKVVHRLRDAGATGIDELLRRVGP